MKKLIAAATMLAASFSASAGSFHANLQCGVHRVQYNISADSYVSINVDNTQYPISMQSIQIPRMGETDSLTVHQAQNQKGEVVSLSFTGMSIQRNQLWLILGDGPEIECSVINSWEGQQVNNYDAPVSNGSRMTVTQKGQ